jgi:hypothetical protein
MARSKETARKPKATKKKQWTFTGAEAAVGAQPAATVGGLPLPKTKRAAKSAIKSFVAEMLEDEKKKAASEKNAAAVAKDAPVVTKKSPAKQAKTESK